MAKNATASPQATIKHRPIGKLVVDETNARHLSQDEEVNPILLASVAASGVLQPLLVKPTKGGKFSVVDGSRRLAAAKAAGIKTVPTVLVEDATALTSVVMNLSVQQMSLFDKYEGYRQAVAAGVSHDEIKKLLAIDEMTAKSIVAIAKIEPTLFPQLRQNKVSQPTIRAIARVPLHAQVAVWNEALADMGGDFVEWKIRDQFTAYFRGDTPFSREQIAVLLPYYEALGGRVERALFEEHEGKITARILDPDLLPKAADDHIKHVRDEFALTVDKDVITLPPATDYGHFDVALREIGFCFDRSVHQTPTQEQADAAAKAVGFENYDAYIEYAEAAEYMEVDEDEAQKKFDAYEAELAKLLASPNAVYVLRLNMHGNVQKIFPCIPLSEATADTGPDHSPGLQPVPKEESILSAVATDRQKAMCAALIQRSMIETDTFGMRWAAWSIYQAAEAYFGMMGSIRHLRVTKDYGGRDLLEGFTADPNGSGLPDELFPVKYSMADFADMDLHTCMDIMIKSITVMQAKSMAPETFHEVVKTFCIEPRDAWDKLVPGVELAEAWFNQFKKPDLVAYAIDALNPQADAIGRVAKDLKKSELVAALAKALVHGAPGQPDAVQYRAKIVMPLGLGLSENDTTTQEAAE